MVRRRDENEKTILISQTKMSSKKKMRARTRRVSRRRTRAWRIPVTAAMQMRLTQAEELNDRD